MGFIVIETPENINVKIRADSIEDAKAKIEELEKKEFEELMNLWNKIKTKPLALRDWEIEKGELYEEIYDR